MPTLTIIPLYEVQLTYAKQAKSLPEAERPALYQQLVIAPYWEELAAGSVFEDLATMATHPILALNALADNAQRMIQHDPTPILQAAFDRASAVLPIPETVAAVQVGDPRDIFARTFMQGVMGRAHGAGRFWLEFHPDIDAHHGWIAATFAHEYHHAAWLHLHYDGHFDLATYLVMEGRAENFVQALYPDRIAPWTRDLNEDEERRYWEQVQPKLHATDNQTLLKLVFGNRKDVPQWAGYRFGFKLVQHFIQRHPGMSIMEWTAVDAHDLIAGSGYVD